MSYNEGFNVSINHDFIYYSLNAIIECNNSNNTFVELDYCVKLK